MKDFNTFKKEFERFYNTPLIQRTNITYTEFMEMLQDIHQRKAGEIAEFKLAKLLNRLDEFHRRQSK